MQKAGELIKLPQQQANTPELPKQPKNKGRVLTSDELQSVMCQIVPAVRYQNARKEDISANVWALTEDFRQRRKEGLFLFGSPGTGKTHLAVALLRAKIETVKVTDIEIDFSGIKFISVPELLLEIRKAFNTEEITEEQIIEKYTDRTKILVLDDLGAEKSTDWAVQTLYLIIDRRYRNQQRTIITSNLSLDGIASKLHDRIASRLTEMCKVLELTGRDRRVEK